MRLQPQRSLTSMIGRLERCPELRWLARFDTLASTALATALFPLGGWLQTHDPQLGTSAGQLLIWGCLISIVVLLHATVTSNSLAHRWGSRRVATRDNSRNNLWREVDPTCHLLRLLARLRLGWNLQPGPVALPGPERG